MKHVFMQHFIAGSTPGFRPCPRPRRSPRAIHGEPTASEEPIGSYSTQSPLSATRTSLGRSSTFGCFLLGGPNFELHGTSLGVTARACGFFSGEKALSSSHYSSLPPCSEMILQEVTLDGKQSM